MMNGLFSSSMLRRRGKSLAIWLAVCSLVLCQGLSPRKSAFSSHPSFVIRNWCSRRTPATRLSTVCLSAAVPSTSSSPTADAIVDVLGDGGAVVDPPHPRLGYRVHRCGGLPYTARIGLTGHHWELLRRFSVASPSTDKWLGNGCRNSMDGEASLRESSYHAILRSEDALYSC